MHVRVFACLRERPKVVVVAGEMGERCGQQGVQQASLQRRLVAVDDEHRRDHHVGGQRLGIRGGGAQ